MGHNWGSFPQLVHRAVTCDRHEGIGCRLKAGASVEGLATERVAATSKPPAVARSRWLPFSGAMLRTDSQRNSVVKLDNGVAG